MRRHLRPHWNQRLSARDDSEAAQHLSQSKWQTWQFWDALLAIAAGFGCGWMPKTKVKHNVMRAPAACRSSAANLPFPSCQASFSAPSHASYLERYRTTSEPGSTFFVVNDSVLKSNPWRVNRSVNSIKPPKKNKQLKKTRVYQRPSKTKQLKKVKSLSPTCDWNMVKYIHISYIHCSAALCVLVQ